MRKLRAAKLVSDARCEALQGREVVREDVLEEARTRLRRGRPGVGRHCGRKRLAGGEHAFEGVGNIEAVGDLEGQTRFAGYARADRRSGRVFGAARIRLVVRSVGALGMSESRRVASRKTSLRRSIAAGSAAQGARPRWRSSAGAAGCPTRSRG